MSPYIETRCSFDLFKSNVCHRLKRLTDIDFLIDVLEKDEIRMYCEKEWYPESLYLLAMVDYLSRLHDIPLCDRYGDLRSLKLKEPVFPSGVLAAAAVSRDGEKIKINAVQNAIPEFARFNIIEREIRNVI